MAGLSLPVFLLPAITCPSLPALCLPLFLPSLELLTSCAYLARPSHLLEPHLLDPHLPEPKLSGGSNYAQKWNLDIAARDLQEELAAVSKESQYHRAVGIDLGLSQCPELIEIEEPLSLV